MRGKAVVIIAAGLSSVVAGLARLILKRRSSWGGLESLVSFSSRKIAASRAREAEKGEDKAIVFDPLAKILAGPQAMALTPARMAPSDSRSITRIIMRTLFFDDGVKASCNPRAAPPLMFKELASTLGSSGSVMQVVLLGSGMDSRPWRLGDSISGAAWFEVDRADVLNVKRRVLAKAGATFSSNKGQAKYRLCSKSWSGVPLNLEERGWTEKLIASGFDPSKATCWVLEGLLYYLEPSSVPCILKEAAQVSASGSTLFASIVSFEFVEALKSRADLDKKSIMSEWKWGCPGQPAEYFGASHWKVLSCPTWQEAASVYNIQPSYEGRPPPERNDRKNSVLYVTAIVDHK